MNCVDLVWIGLCDAYTAFELVRVTIRNRATYTRIENYAFERLEV
jgi:hypothetical protein